MKKDKILTPLLLLPLIAFSQSLSYNELGFIFAKDDGYGTARFEAMGGAFGALGGDESAFSINPAGSGVSKYSSSSATFSNTNTTLEASYYGNNSNYDNNVFNFTQAGSILTFDAAFSKDWTRFALTFNYKIKSDYDAFYSVNGNSGSPNYTQHFMDDAVPKNEFNQAIQQDISSSRMEYQVFLIWDFLQYIAINYILEEAFTFITSTSIELHNFKKTTKITMTMS
ncbi:hypothetical protein [Tenacibaculum sp. SG-28]|uniref:hypothetical protein n=1 Tax=Tenacibaculum sp. SG-28 TaxID=754426 RepID=UPI000CF52F83|nr:hypothetical protein [Tenacibaculum sp. SG-28]PQJ21510.1 hypothetical protein BSU00_05140 [Tenacibaculum sp. SG-28]